MLDWISRLLTSGQKGIRKTNLSIGRGSRCFSAHGLLTTIWHTNEYQAHPFMPVSVILVCSHGTMFRYPITDIEVINGELVLHATRS